MNVVILEVPSDTEFANLPADVQAAIRSVGADFIHGIMPQTRIYQLKKMINSVVYTDLDTIESMIAGFSLDWIVLAMQSAFKMPQYDEQGEPIIDPETGKQVYAVNVYRQVPASFIDYCTDIGVEGERPTVIPPLTRFSGHEEWII